MAPSTTQRQYNSERLTPPTRAPAALLVVESQRRHVAEDNSLEGSNVDPDLHRCSHTQSINFVDGLHQSMRSPAVEIHDYASEQALTLRLVVCLCGQLLTMNPSGWSQLDGLLG